MRVECPCGELLKHIGKPSRLFADLIPDIAIDEYCKVIEDTVQKHKRDVVSQYIVYDTDRFFRRMCQCEQCGRLFIEDENYNIYEFQPVSDECPKDLLSRMPNSKI